MANGIWDLEDARTGHIHSNSLANWLISNLDSKILINDLGCGLGYYAKELSSVGFNVKAYEGTVGIEEISYYKPIFPIDLTVYNDLEKGNVICLEVGEHIDSKYEDIVFDNICFNCSATAIVSWALLYQDGLGHVNCRPNQWVIEQMWKRNFQLDYEKTNSLRSIDFDVWSAFFNQSIFVFNKL